jgi:hypothetical protein
MKTNFKGGLFYMKKLLKVFGIIFVAGIMLCMLLACELIPNQPTTTTTNPNPNQPTPQNQTPAASDYDIGNLIQPIGGVTSVTITPKSGKSGGARAIYYTGTSETKSTTIPQTAGTYVVTFDVAAATGWNAAANLYAGTLTVATLTPAASDFTFDTLMQNVGKINKVIITPKEGKSKGDIKTYYEGIEGTIYPKSETLPTECKSSDKYAVTFEVAAKTPGWNKAEGLKAGTLEFKPSGTQAISVTILGTPAVGKTLTADVQKNFSGENTYQWLVNNKVIDWEEQYYYTPKPSDSGKTISVIATCGGIVSAPSEAKTISPSFDYTVDVYPPYFYPEWYGYSFSVRVWIDDNPRPYYPNSEDDDFKIQWKRGDDKDIPGAENSYYELQVEDAGKTIKVKVSGYGKTRTSSGVEIPALDKPNERLQDTTWQAVYSYYDNEKTRILKFDDTSATWTMNIKYRGSESKEKGTYEVKGNDVSLYYELSYALYKGTINEDNTLFLRSNNGSEEITFDKLE